MSNHHYNQTWKYAVWISKIRLLLLKLWAKSLFPSKPEVDFQRQHFLSSLRSIHHMMNGCETRWTRFQLLQRFHSYFSFFFLVFYIFLYTMNQKAVEKQRISSMCFLGNNFELKIQPISKVIGHSISMSRENGWRRAMDLLPISEGGWT